MIGLLVPRAANNRGQLEPFRWTPGANDLTIRAPRIGCVAMAIIGPVICGNVQVGGVAYNSIAGVGRPTLADQLLPRVSEKPRKSCSEAERKPGSSRSANFSWPSRRCSDPG